MVKRLLVKYHRFFARHRIDLWSNNEIEIKLISGTTNQTTLKSCQHQRMSKTRCLLNSLCNKCTVKFPWCFSAKTRFRVLLNANLTAKLEFYLTRGESTTSSSTTKLSTTTQSRRLLTQLSIGRAKINLVSLIVAKHTIASKWQMRNQFNYCHLTSEQVFLCTITSSLEPVTFNVYNFVRGHVHPVVQIDGCAQYFHDIGMAAHSSAEILQNFRTVIQRLNLPILNSVWTNVILD